MNLSFILVLSTLITIQSIAYAKEVSARDITILKDGVMSQGNRNDAIVGVTDRASPLCGGACYCMGGGTVVYGVSTVSQADAEQNLRANCAVAQNCLSPACGCSSCPLAPAGPACDFPVIGTNTPTWVCRGQCAKLFTVQPCCT